MSVRKGSPAVTDVVRNRLTMNGKTRKYKQKSFTFSNLVLFQVYYDINLHTKIKADRYLLRNLAKDKVPFSYPLLPVFHGNKRLSNFPKLHMKVHFWSMYLKYLNKCQQINKLFYCRSFYLVEKFWWSVKFGRTILSDVLSRSFKRISIISFLIWLQWPSF